MTTLATSSVCAEQADRLADELFDALSHFEGELPAIDELARITDAGVRIVDEEAGGAPHAFQRDAWLSTLMGVALERRLEGQGLFVVERRRTRRASGGALVVRSVVERRVTRGERVVARVRSRWAMTVSLVDGRPRVVGLVLGPAEAF